MKEYLDFENGDITVSDNGNYIDDLDSNEEFEEVSEDIYADEQKEEIIEEIIEEINKEESLSSIIEDSYNPIFLNKLNPTDKTYVDGDYNYKDDTIEPKKPKKIKKKVKIKKEHNFPIIDILNKIFKIILFLARVLFCLILFISIFLFILWNGQKNDEKKDLEKLSSSESVIIESIVTSISKENPSEYSNFVKDVQHYMEDLTAIVNGENIIIDNLNKGLITEKDAYNYFNKTLIKKGDMLANLEKQNFPEELSIITSLVRQITINASNNSKLIMNRYLVDDGAAKMISDMSSFYSKYLTDCELLSSYLGKI